MNFPCFRADFCCEYPERGRILVHAINPAGFPKKKKKEEEEENGRVMTRLQQAELCPTRESSDGLLLLGRSVLIYLSSEVRMEVRRRKVLGGVGGWLDEMGGFWRWGVPCCGERDGGSAIYCPG